MNQCW